MVLAIPELAPIIIALAVLLAVWALSIFLIKPLVYIFEHVPFIGDQVVRALNAVAGGASQFAADIADWALSGIIGLLDWVSGNATMALRWANAAALWIGDTVRATLASLVAGAQVLASRIATAMSRIAVLVSQLAALATRVAAIAVSVARIIAVTVPAAIAQAVATAVARATALLNTLRAVLVAAIATALATALRAVGAEAAARVAADLAARSWAAAQLGSLAAAMARNLAGLQAWAAAQVGALSVAIGRVDARIGPLAWPTVAAAITAIATDIANMRRTCVEPTCNYLGPQLQALELAEDAAMLAAVVGLIAAAAQDPERAAAETIATAGPFVGGARSLLGELTGLGF